MDARPTSRTGVQRLELQCTLRGCARPGQMTLDGGVANGRRIIPAEWPFTKI
jgi:hypothetical protein